MIVSTKDQLILAQKNKEAEIIIEGELAKKIHNGRKLVKVGKWSLLVLAAGLVAAPFTGGTTAVAGFSAAAATAGVEVTLMTSILLLGVAFLFALYKDYDEVDFDLAKLRLQLRRNKNDASQK
jgi:hypothetical protein